MRSEDGRHFENVIGVIDHDRFDGQAFEPNVLDVEKQMVVGHRIQVGDTMFEYRGEDSFDRSIFTRVGQPITDVAFGGRRSGIWTF